MRAVRYYGPGDVRVDEIPEPVTQDGQVKIKVAWNGICGTDLHAYLVPLPVIPTASEPHYVTKETLPIVLGHEFSGTLVELGSGVDSERLKVGQNVVVEPTISCMESTCGPCSSGTKNVCPQAHGSAIGITGWGGGLSEYITVKQESVHVLPSNVPLDVAAMVEPLSVVYHAVKRSNFVAGNTVLIIGAGPIGLLLLKILNASGASWIGVSEPASKRRETALEHSASAVFDPVSSDVVSEVLKSLPPLAGGVDVVFDCAGIQATLDTALKAVKPRGNVVEIAVWEKEAILNVNFIMFKETLFTATVSYDRVHPEVIQLLSEGKLPNLDKLITRKIGLEDVVEKGIKELLREGNTQVKILVHP